MSIQTLTLYLNGPEITRFIQGFGSLVRKGIDTPDAMETYVAACMDVGINTYDLAAVYGGGQAEALLGEVLSRHPGLRSSMNIITKYGITSGGMGYHCYDSSCNAIIESAERSLSRLHTDHIELFLMHRPDMLMDADEVARALEKLHRDGKILHAGVSNFLPSQLELLASRLSLPILVNEVPYSIFDMECAENGTLDHCQQKRVTPLFYSPLGRGRVMHIPENEQDMRVRACLEAIADECGATIDQIALAFVLRHPSRGAAILGGARLEWLETAVKAADIVLTRDQWYRIWTAVKGHEIP